MSNRQPKGERARARASAKTTRSYLWNDGVRVDDENNLADAERLRIVSPSLVESSAFLVTFFDRHAQRLLLDVLSIVIVIGVRERRFLATLDLEPANDLFHLEAERETVVHVARLLEPSAAPESSFRVVVFRPRHPTDAMICVESYAFFAVLLRDELQAIIVNENR